MYKFEIHRNPERPQTINGYDAVRYNASGYIFERTITPIWNDLAFSWEKEDGRVFFRKKLGGAFTLVGSDFDWVNSIRLDANERNNKYRIIIIKELVDNIWTEVWRGFFSVIVGEWDLSNCSASFSELVVWDEYTSYLENIETEKNLLDINSININISTTQYQFDVFILTEFLGYVIPDPDFTPCNNLVLPPLNSSDVYYNDASTPYDDKWTLVDRYVRYVSVGAYFEAVKVYRRDYIKQVTNPGSGWVDTGDEYPVGSSTHKWVRHYLGFDNPPVPTYDVITDTVSAYDPDDGVWYDCEYERRTLNTSDAPGVSDYVNDRARPFQQVVNYAFDSDLTPIVLSSFLNDGVNPVTGVTNVYDRMYVIQFTDIIETSDPATKAMYSAKDVEEWLMLMNVYWYVESTLSGYQIRFEHDEFFNRGLTYGENSIGVDISSQKIPKKMAYANKNLPRLFELIMAYDSGDDFNGTPIIYGGGMANWDREGKDSVSTSSMATDVRGAILNEDAGKDGFFVVACTYDEVAGINVISGTGAWSKTYIYNQPLSVANIEENLWVQRGVTAVGNMNNEDIEFDAVRNNFVQEGVEVAWCDDFNPYKLVRTDYGDAIIVDATLALKDKKLTLTLSYQE